MRSRSQITSNAHNTRLPSSSPLSSPPLSRSHAGGRLHSLSPLPRSPSISRSDADTVNGDDRVPRAELDKWKRKCESMSKGKALVEMEEWKRSYDAEVASKKRIDHERHELRMQVEDWKLKYADKEKLVSRLEKQRAQLETRLEEVMHDYLQAELDSRDAQHRLHNRADDLQAKALSVFGGALSGSPDSLSQQTSDIMQKELVVWQKLYKEETEQNRTQQYDREAANKQLQMDVKVHKELTNELRERVRELEAANDDLHKQSEEWKERYKQEAKCRLNVLQLEEEKVQLQKDVLIWRRKYEQSERTNKKLGGLLESEKAKQKADIYGTA